MELSARENLMDNTWLPLLGCISNIWPLLASLVFIAALGTYSWWRRSVPGAKPLAIACLLGFLWMVGVLGQVTADDVPTKIAWYRFQTVWQVPAATATTLFSLEYAGYGRWLTRRNLLLLSIPPLLALLFIATNESYHLWWQGVAVGDTVWPAFGIGAWLLIGYGWALVFVNIVVLVRLYARSPQRRWPVTLIIAGQLACRALFVVYLANLDLLARPYYLVLSIMVPVTMYGIALFGFRIFDPLSRARRTAIEQMQEGMVVLDSGWRVVSVNPAAEKILTKPVAQLRGRTWPEILPAPANTQDQAQGIASSPAESGMPGPAEMVIGAGADARCYEVDFSPLTDQHDTVVGYLLLLHDISAQRRARMQLFNQQQMLAVIRERERLARELHDSLGQVLAFVNAQGQTARILLARGEVGAADVHVARLVEVAREADTDIRESILGLRAPLAQQRLFPALSAYLDQYQQRYDIRTQLSKPPGLADGAFDPLIELQLLRIIQEALTNARKHAHARAVAIDFIVQDGHAQVTLQDDGRGFDPHEALGDSAGRLGLRVMRERAEEVGGSLELHSQPGQGTRVVVTVPLASTPYDHAVQQDYDYARSIG
jgi:PAS domain S-box-containing protein